MPRAARARAAMTICLSILIGVGAAVAPACAAVTMRKIAMVEARQVTIINGTRTIMVSLQVKDFDSKAWPVDALSQKTLGIQKKMPLLLPPSPSCFYDIKARFEDGHRVLKDHVYLCNSPPIYMVTDY